MRTTPYSFAKQPAAEPKAESPQLNQKSYDESIVTDLSKELARPVSKPAPDPQQEQTTTTSTEPVKESTEPKPETKPGSSANLTEEVGKYKEKLQKEISEAIEDPKRAGKNVLRFINMGRFLLYPYIYKRIIFEETERVAIDATLKKIAQAAIDKKEPELNDFEKGVHKKYQEFQAAAGKVLWSEEEIDQINAVAYLKLAEIKFLRWLMENEWAIVIIYIESKRFVPVVGSRMGFGSLDLSGL